MSLANLVSHLGLTSGLKLCLDSADPLSYSSGQLWLDRSGNGYDFSLGNNGSDTAPDPAFSDVCPNFSFDGADWFTYDGGANEAWMDNIHKAGAAFTLISLVRFGPVAFWPSPPNAPNTPIARSICGDHEETYVPGGNPTNPNGTGFDWGLNADGKPRLRVHRAVETVFTATMSPVLQDNKWFAMSVTMDEAGGVCKLGVDKTFESFSGHYSPTPDSNGANGIFRIGARGVGPYPAKLTSGSYLRCFAAWEGIALTQSQIESLVDLL